MIDYSNASKCGDGNTPGGSGATSDGGDGDGATADGGGDVW